MDIVCNCGQSEGAEDGSAVDKVSMALVCDQHTERVCGLKKAVFVRVFEQTAYQCSRCSKQMVHRRFISKMKKSTLIAMGFDVR